MRQATVSRHTSETKITVELTLDGTGRYDNQTGVGFFDHMLDQLARHAMMDMNVLCEGDLHIDDHHSVEDVGIALGQALAIAVGNKAGINRYGSCLLPMDDALVRAAIDISNRPFLVWNVDMAPANVRTFDTGLVREGLQAFSTHAGLTLRIDVLYEMYSHH